MCQKATVSMASWSQSNGTDFNSKENRPLTSQQQEKSSPNLLPYLIRRKNQAVAMTIGYSAERLH